MANSFTLGFLDQNTDFDYFWGFNNLIINQSYSVPTFPTPEPTAFNYSYAGCPSYNLELSDFTLLDNTALIPDTQISTINKWNNGIYVFLFKTFSKTSEWLLESSTYAMIQSSSTTVLTLDIYEGNDADENFDYPDQCDDPIITLRDNAQFVSIIFSLVFLI